MDSRRISIENYAECLCDCLCDCFNITPTKTTTTGSDAQNLRAHTTLKQLAYTIDRTCITYIYISSIECMAMCVCVCECVCCISNSSSRRRRKTSEMLLGACDSAKRLSSQFLFLASVLWFYAMQMHFAQAHAREYYSILYKVVVTRKCTIWEWEKRAQRREQDAAGRFGGGASLVQARISERIVKCIRAKLTDKMWIWCLWMWMCFVHRTIYILLCHLNARLWRMARQYSVLLRLH